MCQGVCQDKEQFVDRQNIENYVDVIIIDTYTIDNVWGWVATKIQLKALINRSFGSLYSTDINKLDCYQFDYVA